MRLPNRILLATAGLLLIAASGCGNGLESLHGTVTYDDKPLSTGTLAFHPTAKGPTGYATVGPDGTYSACTGSQKGLPAGTYRVSLIAVVMVESNNKLEEPVPQSLIPEKYTSPATSGLEVVVPAPGGAYNIALSSK